MEAALQGAAERLLHLVLNSGQHLWHNRPGVEVAGTWRPATNKRRTPEENKVSPGLFVPAAEELYSNLVEIYSLDPELMAHFASYALVETDWRDLKVASAALMLVQPRHGQPVRDEDGSVAFYEDDFRAIGEAMILHYEKGSTRMFTPKMVLRVANFLETPEIALLNRAAGFADPGGRKPPMGRYKRAATQWLETREQNLPLLEGLVAAGYKETIKQLARKIGYRPQSEHFFELLGWEQKQAAEGHRTVGLGELQLRKQARFEGLDEEAICRRIEEEKLSFKDAVGRLPAGMTLTPAIMAALLPTLSDRDLRIMTPTLESLGLLADDEIRLRWERAIQTADDQRALNIARNVRSRELKEQLETAADNAARKAVSETIGDDEMQVMFLIDKSGSMENAIDNSKEALSRVLAGFPPDQLHIATFDTTGRVLKLKAPTRTGVKHALEGIQAGGGTLYSSALQAFERYPVRIPAGSRLIVIAVGDEAGESGVLFAETFSRCGYHPSAIGLIVSTATGWGRGSTVREAAMALRVPYSEVAVEQFDDPYQVPRVLKAMLDAPVLAGGLTSGWLERVLATPLLTKPA